MEKPAGKISSVTSYYASFVTSYLHFDNQGKSFW